MHADVINQKSWSSVLPKLCGINMMIVEYNLRKQCTIKSIVSKFYVILDSTHRVSVRNQM